MTTSATHVRSFCAVALPKQALDSLLETQAELRRRSERLGLGLRFMDAEQLHITVKFLGDVARERISELCAELTTVSQTNSAIATSYQRLDAFSSTRRASVVVARLSDEQALFEALASDLETRFVRLGFTPETRKFVPHVTIARSRRPCDVRRLLSDASLAGERFEIRELVLFQSTLTPKGSIYTELARALLS